jgi:ubiquinone/menaquinone biosynthesis C-methylase UbiE
MTNVYIKKSEDTWNAIAKSFDSTRSKPWTESIDFIENLSMDSLVVDVGCGNGRHLIPCADRCKKVIGFDVSKELLIIVQKKICKKKLNNVDLIHSDAVNIPLKKNSVDAVLFIATLHNISERYRRIQSLREIYRILKPDGKAIISVWSRWQDRFRHQFLKKCFTGSRKNEFGDTYIHWRQHGLNIPRFYHLYSKREFLSDLYKADLEIIKFREVKIHSKKHPDNYFTIVKRG